MTAERGLTCLNPDEAEINRAMVQQAKQKIAVTDPASWGSFPKGLSVRPRPSIC
jgi:DeoR/GlpR family transcriptional regulator of sugar metabolism